MLPSTKLDLFSGIPVAGYAVALKWDERLLGSPPTFSPHATECVKTTFRDADGNEIGFGGAPL